MSVRHIHHRYQKQIEQTRKDNVTNIVLASVVSFLFGMVAMFPLY